MNGSNQILLHELSDSGTMQVTARHPLMADMQHVSQQVAPEARPPRRDNLHCANIATFVPQQTQGEALKCFLIPKPQPHTGKSINIGMMSKQHCEV